MRIFTDFVGFLLLVSCLYPGTLTAAEPDKVQQKARELEQVKSRIEDLRKQLSSVESIRQEHDSVLGQTEKQIGLITRRMRVIGQSLKRQQQRLATLEQERADARLQLDKHRQVMERVA
jgi:septal ring factor EnvC (AmiA/AmiB activator)